MTLLVLEALGALALLLFIVWWTMFSGRRGGERVEEPSDQLEAADNGEPDPRRDQPGPRRD